MLEKLQEIALRFKVDPLQDTIGHAARLDHVVKTLADINQSYQSFLKIEFLKQETFAKAYARNDKVWDTILEELKLLVIDVSFSSFSAALAPDIVGRHVPLFATEVDEWKQGIFADYNELVYANHEDIQHIASVAERYNEQERAAIFLPLFDAAGDGKRYAVRLLRSSQDKEPRTLIRPADKALYQYYVPKISQHELAPPIRTVMAVMRAQMKEDGTPDLSKKGIKQVMYHEEMAHDTYPYRPPAIFFEDIIYRFASALDCSVSFEEEQYFISYAPLEISVWGDTRDEAESAFAFTFHTLYENFALAADNELTNEAIVLKNKILSLVKAV